METMICCTIHASIFSTVWTVSYNVQRQLVRFYCLCIMIVWYNEQWYKDSTHGFGKPHSVFFIKHPIQTTHDGHYNYINHLGVPPFLPYILITHS